MNSCAISKVLAYKVTIKEKKLQGYTLKCRRQEKVPLSKNTQVQVLE